MKTKVWLFLVHAVVWTAQSLISAPVYAPAYGSVKLPCEYEVNPKTVHVEWTAFKTSEKVGVKGTFPEVKLSGAFKKASPFGSFLRQFKTEIPLSGAKALSTGNPTRDETLFQNFFRLIKGPIKGEIQKSKGTDLGGTLQLKLTLNQKSVLVPMTYTRDAIGDFSMSGTLNVNDFYLQNAMKKLNEACKVLHQGVDGVSKTWPNVDLKITASIVKECKP